ncbi:GNAT family N-acetyltransferase [Kribbella sp. NPDC051770]|uniref:GNAT family N-acetyltransferase n=1 Tax=Kribbella sp. NPDC051770 TaxID=3155413 RepID=UPI00343382E2
MTAALPAGLTVRPAELGDAEVITAQMGAYTSGLLGFPKHSLENVADYLQDPSMELATGSWLVFDGEQLVGSATAVLTGARPYVGLDVFAADPGVAAWLLDTASARGIELARAADWPVSELHVGQLRQDEVFEGLLVERGFARETSVQLMRIDHTAPVDVPEPPSGVKLRVGAYDDATRRVVHGLIGDAFATQPSSGPRPYDEWLASHESRTTFDWSQMTIAELDGVAVGMRECNGEFVSSYDCNYIGRLGVLESGRGRGIAKYLLREQFARDQAAGLSGTMLHVDSSNPTPAVGLYLGVGMRPTVITDIWGRQIG